MSLNNQTFVSPNSSLVLDKLTCISTDALRFNHDSGVEGQ